MPQLIHRAHPYSVYIKDYDGFFDISIEDDTKDPGDCLFWASDPMTLEQLQEMVGYMTVMTYAITQYISERIQNGTAVHSQSTTEDEPSCEEGSQA